MVCGYCDNSSWKLENKLFVNSYSGYWSNISKIVNNAGDIYIWHGCVVGYCLFLNKAWESCGLPISRNYLMKNSQWLEGSPNFIERSCVDHTVKWIGKLPHLTYNVPYTCGFMET